MAATTNETTPKDEAPLRTPPKPLGPGSLLWEIAGDKRFGLMFGSAFVLQTMHPEIGAAVSTESVFRTDPWGRSARSLRSVQKWVYGGEKALEEGRRLRKLHRTIRGVDATGQAYDALDADAWAWVPLTAFHSIVVGFPYLYGRELDASEQARLYEDSLQICRILGVLEEKLPKTVADYHVYFDDMVNRVLVDHPCAHDVIDLLTMADAPPTFSPLGASLWPATRVAWAKIHRTMTIGLLPPVAREILHEPWSRVDDVALRVAGKATKEAFDRMPESSRYFGIAYRARVADRANTDLAVALEKI